MKSKNCPPGKYYCFDDKKCKKIPTGYHIGAKGYLYPDKDNENGDVENVNGNGNGGNGNGNGGGNGGGVSEDNRVRFQKYGRTYAIMLIWRGKTYNTQIFVPNLRQPSRAELEKEIQKIYPGGKITYYAKRDYDPTDAAILVPEETKTKKKISFSIFRTKSKDKERKPEKAMDAGARAKRLLQRREYASKVSGSTENVPDDIRDSFEIDPKAHKSAQKKAKLRNLAKGNANPNEKAAAEKKAGGPKLYGESMKK